MTGDPWDAVPVLSTTEGLCLLAMGHLEAGARRAAAPDHVAAVPCLATASNGRPCARVGYRLPGVDR